MSKSETRKYLKLCQKQWRWIFDNYDRLTAGGSKVVWTLKGAYFDEYGFDEPVAKCYLCELTGANCLECPLSGIAWREDHDFPCTNDDDSVYWKITRLMEDGKYVEAKDAIKEFLSIIDKECRRW